MFGGGLMASDRAVGVLERDLELSNRTQHGNGVSRAKGWLVDDRFGDTLRYRSYEDAEYMARRNGYTNIRREL